MFGLNKEVTCKACCKTNIYSFGITAVYSINGSKIEYLEIICKECGEIQYVAETENVVDVITKAAKEKLYIVYSKFVGTDLGVKERFMRNLQIVDRKNAVILKKDVKSCVLIGNCAY